MKPSELRDKNDEELVTLETELRDQVVKLSIARATQRMGNTAALAKVRRDIARVKTIQGERARTLATREAST